MSRRKKGDGNYEVGYGKPPVHSRFPKNQSGNNNGRPRKKVQSNRGSLKDMIYEEFQRPLTFVENGKKVTLPVEQLLLRKLIHEALSGKPPAMRQSLRLLEMGRESRNAVPFPSAEEIAEMGMDEVNEAYKRLIQGE